MVELFSLAHSLRDLYPSLPLPSPSLFLSLLRYVSTRTLLHTTSRILPNRIDSTFSLICLLHFYYLRGGQIIPYRRVILSSILLPLPLPAVFHLILFFCCCCYLLRRVSNVYSVRLYSSYIVALIRQGTCRECRLKYRLIFAFASRTRMSVLKNCGD